jgi:PAS domain S-box-containing protein
VVEDEALIAAELVDRLRRRGYDVVGPEDNAAAAIDAVEQLRPTVVLMDIRLKGDRDGIDAANEIHRRFNVPVVFLTANADRATYERAHTTAQYGYVLKPFHERDLFLALDLALHRHRIEQDLRANSLTFAAISDAVGDAVVVADRDEIVRYLNPSAERLLGWTLYDAVGQARTHVLKLNAPDSGEAHPIEGIRGDGHDDEACTTNRAGERIPVAWRCRAMVSPHGEPAGHVHTLTDLRSQRRLEKMRRAADGLLRVAFEASPAAIALLDGDGNIVRHNPGFLTIMGMAADAAPIVDAAVSYVWPSDRTAFIEWLQSAPAAGTRTAPVEMHLRHIAGRSVQVLATAVKVPDTLDGQPIVLWQLQRIEQQKELINEAMHRSAAAIKGAATLLPFRHILLVEDEPSLRQILQRMLVRFGLKVTAAPDGEQALEALRASVEIDVVLTDVIMPGMSGGELAIHIERNYPVLPLMFMTGFHDDSFVRERVNSSRRPLLYKPFSGEELERALRALAASVGETASPK